MKRLINLLCIVIGLFSCKETSQEKMVRMVGEWTGKTIQFPYSMTLTAYPSDTVLAHIGEPVVEKLILDFGLDEQTASDQFFPPIHSLVCLMNPLAFINSRGRKSTKYWKVN